MFSFFLFREHFCAFLKILNDFFMIIDRLYIEFSSFMRSMIFIHLIEYHLCDNALPHSIYERNENYQTICNLKLI